MLTPDTHTDDISCIPRDLLDEALDEAFDVTRLTQDPLKQKLITAARKGHINVVRKALKAGNINQWAHNAALVQAHEHDHLRIVTLLIDSGARPDYIMYPTVFCGINTPVQISQDLALFFDEAGTMRYMSRAQAMRLLGDYIKNHILGLGGPRIQYQKDPKFAALIKLKDGVKELTYFNLPGAIRHHFLKKIE